jgi:hypothetical protein
MVKIINDAVSTAIPQEELMDAAKNFLLHSGSHKDLVLGDNIASPQFGSSDLLFVNQGKMHLTVARLNDAEETEKFIISSMSYYVWLKQFVTVGEVFSNGKIEMDMYLFSPDFSAAISYLMRDLAATLEIYLVEYKILQVEGLDEPGIYFQHLSPEDIARDRPLNRNTRQLEALPTEEEETSDPLEISAEELSEFNRLEERYLRAPSKIT